MSGQEVLLLNRLPNSLFLLFLVCFCFCDKVSLCFFSWSPTSRLERPQEVVTVWCVIALNSFFYLLCLLEDIGAQGDGWVSCLGAHSWKDLGTRDWGPKLDFFHILGPQK